MTPETAREFLALYRRYAKSHKLTATHRAQIARYQWIVDHPNGLGVYAFKAAGI